MGRKRKIKFQKLPKYVYNNNGTIVYRPRIDGQMQKPVRLGNSKTPLSEIWSAYELITGQAKDTLQYLIDEYKKSDSFNSLNSKKAINQAFDRLLSAPIGHGKTFGLIRITEISPGVIRKYLDYRNNSSGNREISYLSSAWSWCYERDIVTHINPCKGIRKKHNPPRDRYVTDEEFKIVYNLAPKYIQIAMNLAFLCRMRIGEILDTRVKDMKPEGLIVRRSKGSNDALTHWSDELKKTVNSGLKGQLRVPEMPIVNNGKGSPIRKSAFSTAWQRLMNKAIAEKKINRFTFHDLKAKGVSDFTGDKQKASGHKSVKMVEIYDRKMIEIAPTK